MEKNTTAIQEYGLHQWARELRDAEPQSETKSQ